MDLSKKLVICFEGNIGSGKSSIINSFPRDPDVFSIHPELVEEWKDYNGANLIKEFYENPAKYSFTFQICNLITDYKRSIEMRENQIKNTRRNLMLMERCGLTAKHVFIPFYHNKGFIDDSQKSLLMELDEIVNGDKLLPDMVIYIQISPDEAFRRIRNRNMEEERNITIDDIKGLHTGYELYVNILLNLYEIPVYTIDGNKDLKDIESDIQKLKPIMEDILKKKLEKVKDEETNLENRIDDEINQTCLPISKSDMKEGSMWNYFPFFKYIYKIFLYFSNKDDGIERKKNA
nr:MAG: deoxynucleoside kinase-like protein [Porcellio scaber clopovirus]